ncbi:recombinase family protein [Opitutaceae bacterium TAV4]|nr:recombinase family protein [Opitutaceae bacterium TAV4]RRK02079.1 recombinase family protein [Opitutaceae bacterium TAV3]
MSAIHDRILAPALGASPVPVAIYARVSTFNQIGGRFDSCESQVAICRDYLRKHAGEGWFEAACFTDPAYSGGTLNRPGIQALMRRIMLDEVKIVLIFKLERLLRSTDEWVPLRSFLEKHNCQLVSATEDLSEETPSGRLKNNLLVSVGEYERLNTSAKVRAKLMEQAKRGYWSCGMIPYGYSYDREAQLLSPHPEEAAVVRRIFTEAARLVSLTDIANALSAEGIRTRCRIYKQRDGNRREVGGVRFNSFVLRRMIGNSIYAGQVRMRGERFAGRHEALVSAELWEAANAAANKPVVARRRQLRSPDKHFHLLKGVVHCGCCQRALIPDASGKRGPDGKPYRYYTCCHLHKERTDSACPVRRVSAAGLEAAYIGFLGECCRHPAILASAMEFSRKRSGAQQTSVRAALAGTDRALAELDRHLRNFAEVVTAGGLEVLTEELRNRAIALREEKQQRLVERERLRQDLAACEEKAPDTEVIRHALERFNHVFPTLEQEQQRDFVTLITDRIEIRPAPQPSLRTEGTGRKLSGRGFSLRIKLQVPNLVEGMGERMMVEAPCRGQSNRFLTLETSIVVNNMNAATPVVLLTPDLRLLRIARKSAAPAAKPVPAHLHPMHRALAWSRQLTSEPDVNRAQLARQAGVTSATLTYYLKLLRLAAPIQTFLLNLKTPSDLHIFSLNRMKALAELPVEKQMTEFARLQRRAGQPSLLPACAAADEQAA